MEEMQVTEATDIQLLDYLRRVEITGNLSGTSSGS